MSDSERIKNQRRREILRDVRNDAVTIGSALDRLAALDDPGESGEEITEELIEWAAHLYPLDEAVDIEEIKGRLTPIADLFPELKEKLPEGTDFGIVILGPPGRKGYTRGSIVMTTDRYQVAGTVAEWCVDVLGEDTMMNPDGVEYP